MKSSFIIAAIAAASTVSAYQCPAVPAVNQACRSISVRPLVCNNPNVNKAECNVKQCNQTYIDNYSACQCRRSPNMFYEHSVNVEGLLRRCGMAGLTNPYGNPYQYRPGQGTQTFGPSSSARGGNGGNGKATRIYDGTTYYGGQTAVVSGTTRIVSATAVVNGTMIMPGTTTWISGTPGIVKGTSTRMGATRTAAPVEQPTEAVSTSSKRISGGAIAGIVLGCLGALALATLLGMCWRKKRAEHMTTYSNTNNTVYDNNRAPTRTVVTEKIEPVVVKTVPTAAAATHTTTYNTNTNLPAVNTYSTNTHSTAAPVVNTYNTNTHSTAAPAVNTYSTHNTGAVPASTTTTYNTTTTTNGYNTQPRGVVNSVTSAASNVATGVSNGSHGAVNTVGNGVSAAGTGAYNAASTVGNGVANAASTVGNGVHGVSTTVGNGVHGATTTVGNGVHGAATTVGNGIHEAATTVGNGVSNAATSVGNGVRGAVNSVNNAIH